MSSCPFSPVDYGLGPEFETCPIMEAQEILQKYNGTFIDQVMQVFKDTVGLSCDTYLPWQDRFIGLDYIDWINPRDLPKPAMWTIDSWDRLAVVVKYSCNSAGEGAMALFQRFVDTGDNVALGYNYGIWSCEGIFKYPDPRTPEFFDNLTALLKGEAVVDTTYRTGIGAILKIVK